MTLSDAISRHTLLVLVDEATEAPVYRADQAMNCQGGDVLRPLLGRLFIPPSTEVIRRDVFDEIGTYDESELHRISEDWEFSLRVAERYPVGYVDRPLVKGRRHAGKKTTTMDLDHALRSRRAIIEKTVRRNPDRLADLRAPALANLHTKIGRKWLDREERGRAGPFVCSLRPSNTARPTGAPGSTASPQCCPDRSCVFWDDCERRIGR